MKNPVSVIPAGSQMCFCMYLDQPALCGSGEKNLHFQCPGGTLKWSDPKLPPPFLQPAGCPRCLNLPAVHDFRLSNLCTILGMSAKLSREQ